MVWCDGEASESVLARYFDPKLGRFLTQDSFLGQIDDPPSLHRYLYANDNPLFFVDPTGHIVRQAIDQSINKSTDQASNWFTAGAKAFFKEGGYQAWDLVSFGALHRQDKLVDQNLAGEISDAEYWGKTGANVVISGTQAALTLGTGGAAGTTAATSILWGAAGGVAGQGIADIGEIYGTQTKTLDDVKATDYLLGAALGGLGGYAGYRARVPAPKNKPTPAGNTGQIAEAGQTTRPAAPSAAAPAAAATDVNVQPAIKPPTQASAKGPSAAISSRGSNCGRSTDPRGARSWMFSRKQTTLESAAPVALRTHQGIV